MNFSFGRSGQGMYPFIPPTGTDTMLVDGIGTRVYTRLQCIACMPVYEHKSLEELRLEDYQEGRKGDHNNFGNCGIRAQHPPARSQGDSFFYGHQPPAPNRDGVNSGTGDSAFCDRIGANDAFGFPSVNSGAGNFSIFDQSPPVPDRNGGNNVFTFPSVNFDTEDSPMFGQHRGRNNSGLGSFSSFFSEPAKPNITTLGERSGPNRAGPYNCFPNGSPFTSDPPAPFPFTQPSLNRNGVFPTTFTQQANPNRASATSGFGTSSRDSNMVILSSSGENPYQNICVPSAFPCFGRQADPNRVGANNAFLLSTAVNHGLAFPLFSGQQPVPNRNSASNVLGSTTMNPFAGLTTSLVQQPAQNRNGVPFSFGLSKENSDTVFSGQQQVPNRNGANFSFGYPNQNSDTALTSKQQALNRNGAGFSFGAPIDNSGTAFPSLLSSPPSPVPFSFGTPVENSGTVFSIFSATQPAPTPNINGANDPFASASFSFETSAKNSGTGNSSIFGQPADSRTVGAAGAFGSATVNPEPWNTALPSYSGRKAILIPSRNGENDPYGTPLAFACMDFGAGDSSTSGQQANSAFSISNVNSSGVLVEFQKQRNGENLDVQLPPSSYFWIPKDLTMEALFRRANIPCFKAAIFQPQNIVVLENHLPLTPNVSGNSSSPTASIFGNSSPPTKSALGNSPPPTKSALGNSPPPTKSALGSGLPPADNIFGNGSPQTAGLYGNSKPPISNIFGSCSTPTANIFEASSLAVQGFFRPSSASVFGSPTGGVSEISPPLTSSAPKNRSPPTFSFFRSCPPPTANTFEASSLAVEGFFRSSSASVFGLPTGSIFGNPTPNVLGSSPAAAINDQLNPDVDTDADKSVTSNAGLLPEDVLNSNETPISCPGSINEEDSDGPVVPENSGIFVNRSNGEETLSDISDLSP